MSRLTFVAELHLALQIPDLVGDCRLLGSAHHLTRPLLESAQLLVHHLELLFNGICGQPGGKDKEGGKKGYVAIGKIVKSVD